MPAVVHRLTHDSPIPFAREVASLLKDERFQLFEVFNEHRLFFLVPADARHMAFILAEAPGDFHVMMLDSTPSKTPLRLAALRDAPIKDVFEGYLRQLNDHLGRHPLSILFVADWDFRNISPLPCVKNIPDMRRFLATSVDYNLFGDRYRPNGV